MFIGRISYIIDSNVTLKYIPASTVHHHAKQLKSGDIAGIVIGGLVVLGLLIIGGASYYAYARRVRLIYAIYCLLGCIYYNVKSMI